MENPVLGNIAGFDSYIKESITYLNHLNYNYFDFCNSMFTKDTNDNKPYYCDILELEKDFDPLRTFQYIKSYKFDT